MKRNSWIWLLVLLVMGCTGGKHEIENQKLQEAVDCLWSYPQMSWNLLDGIFVGDLSESDGHIYTITRAHAYLKLNQQLPDAWDMEADADYCAAHGMPRYEGEAYYIAGADLNRRGVNDEAMRVLKQAERAFGGTDVPDILLGMMYYKMGRISETEQLYDVAHRYYEKAVPYLDSAGLALYAACGYRELARTSGDSVQQRACFEKAEQYAQALDKPIQMDIRYAMLSKLDPQSEEKIAISRYMCDSVGEKRYAYDLVRYYLNQHQLESAKHYLEVLAEDTANLAWSKQKYVYLLSRYQNARGQYADAYETLLGLYDQQSGEIEATGMTRTFAISELFDNTTAREQNLELQVEKQRLYMVLFGLLVLILVVSIVLVVLQSRKRTAVMVQQARQEAEIRRLRAELALRREALQRMLAQRVSLSKNLQESVLRHKEKDVPAWAKEFVETNIFTTEEQWRMFRDEFDACYGDLLTRLKQEHAALTPADLQVIALTVVGLDISDICLLMNLAKRTIWSRRLRIKEHLGLGAEDQLDEWLRGQTLG